MGRSSANGATTVRASCPSLNQDCLVGGWGGGRCCFCWILGVHYVFCILVLYQVYALQIFSLILWAASSRWWLYPLVQKSFQFWHYLIYLLFSFVACAFGVKSKKSLPNPRSRSFSPMFLFESFAVLALTQDLGVARVSVWMWCEVRFQLHSPTCRHAGGFLRKSSPCCFAGDFPALWLCLTSDWASAGCGAGQSEC